MRKAIVWGGHVIFLIGGGVLLGWTLANLVANSQYSPFQCLTENGIFINAPAPSMQWLPFIGEKATPDG